ncbi:MAG TPA: hypothetical protein VGM90_15570 [Kofleriaceae bacterium]|jgi:hypothetical protein
MSHHIIRYRTKPDRTDENKRLIEAVFAELRESPLPGVQYRATCSPDGVFTHFVSYADGIEGAQLPKLASFRRFQEGIKERCLEQPARTDETLIGSFG